MDDGIGQDFAPRLHGPGLFDPPSDPPAFPSDGRRADRERKLAALRVAPPSPQRVARRLLCLGALHKRAALEIEWQAAASPGKAAQHARDALLDTHLQLLKWFQRYELDRDYSVDEALAFIALLGQMKVRALVDAGWLGETAAPLLWALGCFAEMPAFDWRPAKHPIEEHVPVLQDATRFLGEARLRPAKEIARARDIAELWHWRARTRLAENTDPDGKLASLGFRRELLGRIADWSAQAGGIPAPRHGDLPAFGKPYAALSEDEHAYCRSLAAARHKALNWLCGYAGNWDGVPTDT